MPRKLLLADDSITIQKVIELVLSDEDFSIRSVGDGEAALTAVQEFTPDIILADIEMPELNGFRLCEMLKSRPETKNIPVILMAGAFEQFDENALKNSGAEDYIIKPFESRDLINKIRSVLAAKGSSGPATPETKMPAPSSSSAAVYSETSQPGGPAGKTAEKPVDAGTANQLPELPSMEKIHEMINNAVKEHLSSALLQMDINSSIQKILEDRLPGKEHLTKQTEDIIRRAMAELFSGCGTAVWATLPKIAEEVISREIEKIRSEL